MSDLATCLDSLVPSKKDPPDVNASILDGLANGIRPFVIKKEMQVIWITCFTLFLKSIWEFDSCRCYLGSISAKVLKIEPEKEEEVDAVLL